MINSPDSLNSPAMRKGGDAGHRCERDDGIDAVLAEVPVDLLRVVAGGS